MVRKKTSPRQKRNGNKKRRKIIRPTRTAKQNQTRIVEEVVRILGTQIMELEIKVAVQQFLINETIDAWQHKGWLNDQEVKGLFERTYQYWKNDLKGKGNPFSEIDLATLPALQQYQKLQDPKQLSEMHADRDDDSDLISQMKEEMKALKRKFLMQKLEEIRQNNN